MMPTKNWAILQQASKKTLSTLHKRWAFPVQSHPTSTPYHLGDVLDTLFHCIKAHFSPAIWQVIHPWVILVTSCRNYLQLQDIQLGYIIGIAVFSSYYKFAPRYQLQYHAISISLAPCYQPKNTTKPQYFRYINDHIYVYGNLICSIYWNIWLVEGTNISHPTCTFEDTSSVFPRWDMMIWYFIWFP